MPASWSGLCSSAFLCLALACLFACSGQPSVENGESSNLLSGLTPRTVQAVQGSERLTDDVTAKPGDLWKSQLTAVFQHRSSYVLYDLGTIKEIRAAWLLGDNNDDYLVSGSTDNQHYTEIWEAGRVGGSGLQERKTTSLNSSAQYIRVAARGGDGSFSLAEIQLFSRVPERLPWAVRLDTSIDPGTRVRGRMLNAAAALVLLLLLAYRGAPRWLTLLLGVTVAACAYELTLALGAAWPLDQRDVSLARWAVAIVAFIALLREMHSGRFVASRPVLLGVLGLCGWLGVVAFFNLGQPQFYDQALGAPTFVHHLDLKQYYATAKYFPELGYRGVYEADLAAFLEDTHVEISSIANVPMRSLHTHQMSTVAEQRERILSAKSRFTPDRWERYKKDARYFRSAMGERGYSSTFYDLGGNATPVWLGVGYLLFNQFDASDSAFLLTALLDPLLLLVAFFAIGRTFGVRTAFFCMVIFGANDFIMYGTNWGGATLRHDWMAYLALGACALKREHWLLGGVLLTLAAGVRAFPALALMGAMLPALWRTAESVYSERKLPTFNQIRETQAATLKVALAASITAVALFATTSLLLGFESWSDWSVKVVQLSADPHANHISLRGLVAGWEDDQAAVIRDRLPIYVGSIVGFIALVCIAGRRLRPEQSAILALVLTPVLFYPANYYLHLIWLLPLSVSETRGAPSIRPFDQTGVHVIGTLLLLCAAQYFTVLETERGLHFYFSTVLLFGAIVSILVAHVREPISEWLGL